MGLWDMGRGSLKVTSGVEVMVENTSNECVVCFSFGYFNATSMRESKK